MFYQVIPRAPEYLLRSPNAQEIPLSNVLRDYNGFVLGRNSIELRPKMQIRIENAYYEKGFSRKGLKGYLGTEVARYEVTKSGLRLLSTMPMQGRPETDLPVQQLIPPGQLRFTYYRLYFEILFDRKTDAHGSVLLAGRSNTELDSLSATLSNSAELCRHSSAQCTIFPEACSVSIEINIVVNGQSQLITWGSLLSSVVNRPPAQLEVKRIYHGQLTPVKLDAADLDQLRLPLLPGDHINWR